MNLVFIAVQYVVFCVFLYRIWFWFLVFFCIDFFSTPLVLWNLYFLPSLPLFLGRMPETNTHTFLFFICSTEAAQINPLAISLDLSCSMLFAPQIINMFSTYFQIPDSYFSDFVSLTSAIEARCPKWLCHISGYRSNLCTITSPVNMTDSFATSICCIWYKYFWIKLCFNDPILRLVYL